MRVLSAAILPLVFGTMAATGTEAATLRVPEDFSTLGAACAAAELGDEVLVAAGVHGPAATSERFPIRITGALVIRGAGADRTVLNAAGAGPVLEIDLVAGQGSVRIHGLTIERGRSAQAGGAVRVQHGQVSFSGVRFSGNDSPGEANAVWIADGSVSLTGCLFDANGAQGSTLSIRSGELVLDHCTFASNAGTPVEARGLAAVTLRHSVVAAPGIPGGPAAGLRVGGNTPLLLEDNLFDGCFDGVLTGLDGPVAFARLRSAQEANGVRTGSARLVDPFLGDFRLADAGAPGLGAYEGPSPLSAPRSSRPDRAEAARETERSLLGPNVPNPGNPGTTIHFSVPVPSVVDLGIYNVLGQRVRSLISEHVAAGEHREAWDGRDDLGEQLPPGIYFIRVTQGGATESRRLVLVR